MATIRQYLAARLIDELHLAIRPVLLGSGEHPLGGIDLRALGYECVKHVASARATHVFLRKRSSPARSSLVPDVEGVAEGVAEQIEPHHRHEDREPRHGRHPPLAGQELRPRATMAPQSGVGFASCFAVPVTQEADQSTGLPADEALIAPWWASAVSLACPSRSRVLSAANSGVPRSSDGSTMSRATRSNRRPAPIDRYQRA